MIIKTKFNIGDQVHFLRGMHIETMDISEIRISVSPCSEACENCSEKIHVKYMDNQKGIVMQENYLYKTKNELLNSIR